MFLEKYYHWDCNPIHVFVCNIGSLESKFVTLKRATAFKKVKQKSTPTRNLLIQSDALPLGHGTLSVKTSRKKDLLTE